MGGFTNNTGGIAGNLQLFPGLLNTTSTIMSSAVEGNLQIEMAVQGVFHTATQTQLACYSSTNQTAQLCNSLTSPLLGVFLPTFGCFGSTCSTGNSSAVMTPPSRALVSQSSTTAATWFAGTPVCRDTTAGNAAYAAIPAVGVIACPIGQAVGVAVGDTGTTHLVDLDFAPQGTTSSGNATTYATAASSLATAASGNLLAADGNGNVKDSGTVAGGFFWAVCGGTVGPANPAAYLFFPSLHWDLSDERGDGDADARCLHS